MVTCRKCNNKVKMMLNRYATECPDCDDIVDFSDEKIVSVSMKCVLVVITVAAVLIGTTPFVNELPFLLRIGTRAVIIITVAGITYTTYKWIIRKAYNKRMSQTCDGEDGSDSECQGQCQGGGSLDR